MSEMSPFPPDVTASSKKPIVACILLALLFAVVGIAAYFLSERSVRPDLEFAGYGHGFDGNDKLPREVIQAALQKARTSMLQHVKSSRSLETATGVFQWAAFLIGAAVTIMAGYHWQAGGEGLNLQQLKKALGRKATSFKFVGALSATASVLCVAGAKIGEASARSYERAKETQVRLNTAVSDLQKAKTPEEAQAVLDELSVRR